MSSQDNIYVGKVGQVVKAEKVELFLQEQILQSPLLLQRPLICRHLSSYAQSYQLLLRCLYIFIHQEFIHIKLLKILTCRPVLAQLLFVAFDLFLYAIFIINNSLVFGVRPLLLLFYLFLSYIQAGVAHCITFKYTQVFFCSSTYNTEEVSHVF